MGIEIVGEHAIEVWISDKSKTNLLAADQGILYLVNDKLGQSNAESHINLTNIEAFQERYKHHKSAMSKDHVADLLVVFDMIYGINFKYDDAVRLEINKLYAIGEINFHANVNRIQTPNLNSEALINFEFARDGEVLIKIIKQYFNVGEFFNTKVPLKYRFQQKEASLDIVNILKTNGTCLLASYTGSGKTISAIDSTVRLLSGGLVLVTTPIIDTMNSFQNNINKFHFGDNRDRVITYLDSKEFNKTKFEDILLRTKSGELIFLVLSVQDIRYDDSTSDNKNDIRQKYKMLNNNIDMWISDERHYQYEGTVTKEKFKSLTAKYYLHLTATPYNVYSYYTPDMIVSRSLIWGLNNQKHTGLPSVKIESFNSSFSGLSKEIKNLYSIEEGLNPQKLFIRDIETNEFVHGNDLISFFHNCYCRSVSKSKNHFSINNDPKLSQVAKKHGMVVLPNGLNGDGANEYIPALANLINDAIKEIYFIDSYKLEKDANKSSMTVGDYYTQLLAEHQKIIILTCGKFLTGSDIPPLGHLILMDKIQSIALFEQVMGRIMRVYDEKEFVKIYSISPTNELGLVLGRLSKISKELSESKTSDILDNIPISEYVDGQFNEYSVDSILEETNNWFISQVKNNNIGSSLEDAIIKDVDLNILKELTKYKGNKKALPTFPLSDDNGSKVKIVDQVTKKQGETEQKVNKKEIKLVQNAINIFKNMITEGRWISYCEKDYNYSTLFQSDTMLQMFKRDDINIIIEMLKQSESLREIINGVFSNLKMSFNHLSPNDISKHIFVNSSFKQGMGIVYLSDEITEHLVNNTVIDNETGEVLIVNALNGALPLALKRKYPNLTITCYEFFKQYEDHLISLGFNVTQEFYNE